MNPGKNDNVYIGKTNGSRVYEQKRYLLWSIRDILEILKGNSLSEESTFVSTFDTELSFSLFYRFEKMHKQYIYNSKIPHNSYFCEICENTSLLGKGLDNENKTVEIPTDPVVLLKGTLAMMKLRIVCWVIAMLANDMVCLKQTSLLKAMYLVIAIVIVIVILGVMPPSNSTIGIKLKVVTCLKCK